MRVSSTQRVFLVDEGSGASRCGRPFTRAVDIPGARPGMMRMSSQRLWKTALNWWTRPAASCVNGCCGSLCQSDRSAAAGSGNRCKGSGIEVVKLLKVESVVVDVRQKETVKSTVLLPQKPTKILEVWRRL